MKWPVCASIYVLLFGVLNSFLLLSCIGVFFFPGSNSFLLHFYAPNYFSFCFFSLSCKIILRIYLLSPRLYFFIVLKRDLFVYRDDSLASW